VAEDDQSDDEGLSESNLTEIKRHFGDTAAARESLSKLQKLVAGADEGKRFLKGFENAAPKIPQIRDFSADLVEREQRQREQIESMWEDQRREAEEKLAREQHALDLSAELVRLQEHLVQGQQALVERQDEQARHARTLFWLEVAVLGVSVLALIVGIIAL
jgi:hypothetical protein